MGTAGGAEETQESTLNYCSARENLHPLTPKDNQDEQQQHQPVSSSRSNKWSQQTAVVSGIKNCCVFLLKSYWLLLTGTGVCEMNTYPSFYLLCTRCLWVPKRQKIVQTCLPEDETVEGNSHGPHIQRLQEITSGDIKSSITANRFKTRHLDTHCSNPNTSKPQTNMVI